MTVVAFAKRSGRRLGRQQGFSLIELMIALVLGLLVVGAAIGIFLSNRQTYQATEGVGRAQEGVRT
ncbi:prepilin-type N-terminal cleavage/methylation domain-containing protein, partial [Bacillus sp. SIMBA_074]|uniref:PilW family protein n=1 Tax=Bacillus sp. SIMBA_074 TaxID=3085812 RepID=UPI0039786F8E